MTYLSDAMFGLLFLKDTHESLVWYLQMKWYAAWDLLQNYLGDSEDERKLPY